MIVGGGAGDLRVLAEVASRPTDVEGYALQLGGGFGEPADSDAVVLQADSWYRSVLPGGLPPVRVLTGERSMIDEIEGVLGIMDRPVPVPVGYGLKPVPVLPVGSPVGAPYEICDDV